MDYWVDCRRPGLGGRILARNLMKLREELQEYFGQLNEIAMGLHPKKIAEIPEAFVRYRQRKDFGIPYVDGGLLDQPYIWVQEDGVISSFLKEWKTAPTKSKDEEWLTSPDLSM